MQRGLNFIRTGLCAILTVVLVMGAWRVQAAEPSRELVRAAEGGEPAAMLKLGLQYLDREDGSRFEDATRWLRRAALAGQEKTAVKAYKVLRDLQQDLVLRAQVDHDLTLDPALPSAGAALFATDETDAAIELLIREAWLLNPTAEQYLQILYEEKFEKFPRYDPRILAYFRAAAKDGIPSAQVFLGHIHLYGLGMPADSRAGIQLLKTAGHPQAYMELAEYALSLKDENLAARHWLAAADEFQFAPALFNLGVRSLRDGNNRVAKDYFERTLARDPAHMGARLELARLLSQGGRIPVDPQRALQLLESVAAEADGRIRLLALANLGLIYMEGLHVPPDPEKALILFRKAEAGGLESAASYVRQLEAK